MNILDAAYHTVHDYPGGAAALAVRLGKNSGTLSHEVRPPQGSSAKLGLADASKIMTMASDLRMLQALAAEHRHTLLPMPALEAVDDCSAAHLATVAREFADVLGEVATAMADGRVCDNELHRIERQWGELVAAGQQMLGHFSALNAAEKPIRLREVA